MGVAGPGWYDDPEGVHQSRYWDGANWTARVADDGRETQEPMPDPPAWYKQSRFGSVQWSDTPPHKGWVRDGRRWVDPTKPRPKIMRRWDNLSGNVQLFVIIGLVLALLIPMALLASAGKNDPDTDDLEYGAFDVCTQFVKDRLRAPATAEFPNQFEDDGEVRITHTGETYTVVSQVDSENGFGALLTTPFTCVVRHTSGDNWRLVDLNMLE